MKFDKAKMLANLQKTAQERLHETRKRAQDTTANMVRLVVDNPWWENDRRCLSLTCQQRKALEKYAIEFQAAVKGV